MLDAVLSHNRDSASLKVLRILRSRKSLPAVFRIRQYLSTYYKLFFRSFTVAAGVKIISLHFLQSLPSDIGYLLTLNERNNFLTYHFGSCLIL